MTFLVDFEIYTVLAAAKIQIIRRFKMACRNTYKRRKAMLNKAAANPSFVKELTSEEPTERHLFGVDSAFRAYELLQNNLDQFEWVVRNKIYPNFYGRYLSGNNSLTKEEVQYLHKKGCKIALIYACENKKITEKNGMDMAQKVIEAALACGVPNNVAIFLEIDENEEITNTFMHGYAQVLLAEGYTPGFKANTDAKFAFDREFSRGMQNNQNVFKWCLIWAVAPTISEYDGITTSHLIHPDEWKPFAPSCISRKEIAIWQYGKDAHPIENDDGKLTVFNLNLVRNEQVIIEKML